MSWVWRDMAGQRGMGRAGGAERERLAPTVFRRADGIQLLKSSTVMDLPLQNGGAERERANFKKATHEQAFLVHVSSRKLHARASHRRPGPPIARVDRSRCPAVRTRVGSAQSRGAHHRLSHHPHDPEGPRNIADSGDRLNTDPIRTFV